MNAQKDSRNIKDISNYIRNDVQKTNPFSGNVSAEQAYKRTERIAAACYLVTNHVRNDEPVRARLRTSATNLLRTAMELRSGFRTNGSETTDTFLAEIRETISLVRILCVAGNLSRQNGDILIGALDDLGAFITQAGESALSENIVLSRAQFVPQTAEAPPPEEEDVAPKRRPRQAPRTQRRAVSDRPAGKPKRQGERAAERMKEKHRERRLMILDILKQSGSIGIKDISAQITDCSEKTIQRELSDLVRKGHVRKKGAKRWSQYELIAE